MQNRLPQVMRKDLEMIAKLVQPGSKVLDIGCGEGVLLEYLAEQKAAKSHGIELIQAGVSACVKRGLSVIQGDADHDLIYYPDGCFDYVISSQTLQATHNPKLVLQEILRIAKRAIISVPNFGYWYNRLYLSVKGRMPVSSTLSYQWYETPNIHFCTVKDFEVLCQELGCVVEDHLFVGKNGKLVPAVMANSLSELGIFVLKGRD
ncbi:MAG: methionine biosynthesis protein MetW [Rickettsiales bacterium]|jgi:methionine biosynthesis protein MetW|nr:methionine biosynthesis protein MetW [Rickettsiales bacterium]